MVGTGFQPLDTTVRQRYVSKRGKKQSERRRQLIPVSDFSGTESAVIYVGRIPHGFYEDQMRGVLSTWINVWPRPFAYHSVTASFE